MNATNAGPHDWHPDVLPANVSVGEGSWLYSSFAFLHFESCHPVGLRVGRYTGVYDGTMFDVGPNGRVEIGDYCTVAGPVISTDSHVTIGDFTLISYDVVFADGPFALPSGCRTARNGGEAPCARGIEIGEACWISVRAVLLGGARLGRGAIVGAGAVVGFEVPPYAVVAGNPGRVVGWSRPRAHGGAT